MQNNNSDRRYQRTQKLLQEALVALMSEKGYDKITVQDIIDRANVGRSTFYAHYQDKEDLLLRGVALIAHQDNGELKPKEAKDKRDCNTTLETISTVGMFTHVKENGTLHELMYSKLQENPIREKGTAFLYANIESQLHQLVEDEDESSVPIPFLAHYLTGGLMSLAKWWVDNDMPYSPQEMDALFQQVAMPGIRQVLGIAEDSVSKTKVRD